MKRVALAATWALACSLALSAQAQTGDAYRDAVRRLMDITGSAQLGAQLGSAMVAQMVQALRASRPDLPARAYDLVEEVSAEVLQEEIPALFDDMVSVYEKHFSLSEIEQMIAFYETPLGRKSISVMPTLMAEAMEKSKAWAVQMQPRLRARMLERLQAEGLAPAEAR